MHIELDCEIHLISDYAKILAHELESMGIPVNVGTAPDDICLRYHNFRRRLISARPRRIHKTAEFLCPEEYALGLECLENEVLEGHDLLPRLSRYIADIEKASRHPDFDDDLLNDWGIHHLHLGERTNNRGVVEGTEYVLLVMFLPSDAYFIGLFHHGEWSKIEIIQRIHRNWPDLLDALRLNDLVALEGPITDEDREQLRKGHVNTLIQVEPGVVYGPLGGGMTASGVSVEVVEQWHWEKRLLLRTEDNIKTDLSAIREEASRKSGAAITRLRFQLALIDSRWVVVEQNSNLIFETGLIVANLEV